MYDRSLLLEQLDEVDEAIHRIERRFQGIASAADFIASEAGLDRLDGIAREQGIYSRMIILALTTRRFITSAPMICPL